MFGICFAIRPFLILKDFWRLIKSFFLTILPHLAYIYLDRCY